MRQANYISISRYFATIDATVYDLCSNNLIQPNKQVLSKWYVTDGQHTYLLTIYPDKKYSLEQLDDIDDVAIEATLKELDDEYYEDSVIESKLHYGDNAARLTSKDLL